MILCPFSQGRKTKCSDFINFSQLSKLENTGRDRTLRGLLHSPYSVWPLKHLCIPLYIRGQAHLHAPKPWHLILSFMTRKGSKGSSFWPFSSSHTVFLFESGFLDHFDIQISVVFCSAFSPHFIRNNLNMQKCCENGWRTYMCSPWDPPAKIGSVNSVHFSIHLPTPSCPTHIKVSCTH